MKNIKHIDIKRPAVIKLRSDPKFNEITLMKTEQNWKSYVFIKAKSFHMFKLWLGETDSCINRVDDHI